MKTWIIRYDYKGSQYSARIEARTANEARYLWRCKYYGVLISVTLEKD